MCVEKWKCSKPPTRSESDLEFFFHRHSTLGHVKGWLRLHRFSASVILQQLHGLHPGAPKKTSLPSIIDHHWSPSGCTAMEDLSLLGKIKKKKRRTDSSETRGRAHAWSSSFAVAAAASLALNPGRRGVPGCCYGRPRAAVQGCDHMNHGTGGKNWPLMQMIWKKCLTLICYYPLVI